MTVAGGALHSSISAGSEASSHSGASVSGFGGSERSPRSVSDLAGGVVDRPEGLSAANSSDLGLVPVKMASVPGSEKFPDPVLGELKKTEASVPDSSGLAASVPSEDAALGFVSDANVVSAESAPRPAAECSGDEVSVLANGLAKVFDSNPVSSAAAVSPVVFGAPTSGVAQGSIRQMYAAEVSGPSGMDVGSGSSGIPARVLGVIGDNPIVAAKSLSLAGDNSQLPVGGPKQTWVSVASKDSLTKFNYKVSEIDGKAVVEVPDEALGGMPLWEDFLIGRFASTAPHIAKIHMIVNKIWTLGDKTIKIDVFRINDTTVKFRIRNVSARLRALRRGMWNICEIPMVVSKWSPIVEEAQPAVKSMPMWIKIQNVPQSMFTWKGLSFLASPVGTPLRLHPETELVTKFDEAKVFVEVDLSKELPKSYLFSIRGAEVEVNFDYPWLPQRCDSCEKWGHGSDSCLLKGSKVSYSASPNRDSEKAGNMDSPRLGLKISQKEKETIETESVVSLEVKKDVLISELEEGEIPEETHRGKNLELEVEEDEGWEISSSGRKKSRKSRTLAFGQVTILSPSRFDALLDENATAEAADGLIKTKDTVVENQLSSESEKEGQAGNIAEPILPQIKVGSEEAGLRPSLPRNSKSTQKPRDGIPGNISKRTSRKRH